jgi:hypothetical protein
LATPLRSFHLHDDPDRHGVARIRLTEDGETHDAWIALNRGETLLLQGFAETLRHCILQGRALIPGAPSTSSPTTAIAFGTTVKIG